MNKITYDIPSNSKISHRKKWYIQVIDWTQQTTKHKIKPVIYCLINDKVPTFKVNLFCKKTKIIEWISDMKIKLDF